MVQSQNNTFEGGLNQDSAPDILKPTQYVDAMNLQLVQVESNPVEFATGNSYSGVSSRLTNIKGHELWGSFPDIPEYTYLDICFEGASVATSVDITLNGGLFSPGQSYTSANPDRLIAVQSLATQIDTFAAGVVIATVEDDPTLDITCLKIRPTGSNLANSNVTVTSATIDGNPATTTTKVIPAQTGLTPIGYGHSSEELVVLTTASTNTYPSSGTPNIGQIWLIGISQYDTLPSITLSSNLKYNDELNLSLRWQADCEYVVQDDCIKRFLWTDNYNEPRSFQITDQLSTDPVVLLSFSPGFKIGEITYINRITGSLPAGVYQYAYRLVTADGKITPFTPLTRHYMLGITDAASYLQTDSQNVGFNSGQGARIRISDVDTSFSVIEVAAAYFTSRDGEPAFLGVVYSGSAMPTVEFDHVENVNVSNFGQITTSDLGLYNQFVTKAAHLAVANNRSILADFCEQEQTVVDTSGISHSFVIKEIESDTILCGPAIGDTVIGQAASSGTYATPPPDFDWNSDYTDMKGVNTEHNLRGYMRGETYRFGLVLFYKNGTVGFVDKIGDIKFPELYDPGYALTNEYPPTPINGDSTLRLLGIEFGNIDLFSIKDQIKGFSIVRAKRVKSTIAQAAILPGYRLGGFDFAVMLASPDLNFNIESPLENITNLQEVSRYAKTCDSGLYPDFGASFRNKYYNYSTTGPSLTTYTSNTFRNGNFQATGPIADFDTQGVQVINTITVFPLSTKFDVPLTLLMDTTLNPFSQVTIVNLKNTTNPTYPADEDTIYISTGHYQPVDDDNSGTIPGTYVYDATIFGGDTFVTYYTRISRGVVQTSPGPPPTVETQVFSVVFPVETTVNAMLRYPSKLADLSYTGVIVEDAASMAFSTTVPEAFNYSTAFSQEENIQFFVARPAINSECETCYPYRFIASKEQTPGLNQNNLVSLQSNNILDVSPIFGRITGVNILSNDKVRQIYFTQETAFGFIPYGAYSLSVDNAAQVNLGTGTLFGTQNYIDETIGSIHKWSFIRGKNSLYFYSDPNKRIYRFNQAGLKDLSVGSNMVSWFNRSTKGISTLDNPIFLGGVHMIYDPAYDDVWVTMKFNQDLNDVAEPQDQIPESLVPQPEWSLVFNERTNTFVSFRTETPGIFIRIAGNRLISPNPSNPEDLYLHYANEDRNVFYGALTAEDSYIVYVVNSAPDVAKVAGSLELIMSGLWDSVEMASFDLKDIGGSPIALRGRVNLLSPGFAYYYQPRNGKWQGPAPMATDVKKNGVWANNSNLARIAGEKFFTKLLTSSLQKRELMAARTYFTKSLRNR